LVALGVVGCGTGTADRRTGAATVHVDSARVAPVAAETDTLRTHSGVPGASVVIVSGDSVILSRGFGFRDAAIRLPVTPRTRFVIGSCTKPFTALAAAISADRGLLSLDDSPRRFLPYFHLRDPVADGQVALRDLLSHRTGMPDHLGGRWFERFGTREISSRQRWRGPPLEDSGARSTTTTTCSSPPVRLWRWRTTTHTRT
jgi:CubicO group peptidase (beta-lactamase class C family)